MGTVLFLLGVLGFILLILDMTGAGATVLSLYMFAIAAQCASSRWEHSGRGELLPYVVRSGEDRRKNPQPVSFPLTVNGVLIERDRRRGERRAAAW